MIFAILILTVSTIGIDAGSSKIYGSIPGLPICVAPAGCLMGLTWMCPPCYKPGQPQPGTGSGTGTGTGGPPADIQTQRQNALDNGNSYRAKHSAPPLTRDAALEADAQAYAEKLCATRPTFGHDYSILGKQGENLARIPSSQPSTIARANDLWYSTEVNNYCPGGAPVGSSNGHFTQMVWKSSTKVGYGSATCPDGNTYIVARYSPPGNDGTERTNVSCA